MPGGGVQVGGDPLKKYPGRLTTEVVFACVVAATGGLIFGYDIGISGGVSGMDTFLSRFFPEVYERKHSAHESNYCKFDSQALQAFTSSLYIAGLAACIPATYLTRNYGRRVTIILGGASFFIGAVLNGAAMNMPMLITGRIFLGAGVGLGNQSVPLYLSEMAPAQNRGSLNIMFQLMVCIGILVANLINFGTQKIHPWGWRLSLGLAAIPALIMAIGGYFLPETPTSLVERGLLVEARKVLMKIRGMFDVEMELADLVASSLVGKKKEVGASTIVEKLKDILTCLSLMSRSREASREVANPHPHRRQTTTTTENKFWRNKFWRRFPYFTIAVMIPFLQQLTGINVINFYVPILFLTIGFGTDASLYSAVITGAVNLVCTIVSIVAVDRIGRRFLFLQGGIQMLAAELVIGVILQVQLHDFGALHKPTAMAVVVMICVYVAAFAWSWGPLGWLVPSEIFPLELRSMGQSVTVAVNLLFTFIIAQCFLTMLCQMKFGIFYFFAVCLFCMTIFIYFFLPETKGVHIENMDDLWSSHWYWKRYFYPKNDKNDEVLELSPEILDISDPPPVINIDN